MRISPLLAGAVASTAATPAHLSSKAHHHLSDAASAMHAYTAPGPSDSRSPCPMMNTLANHNYLPHSGRDITIDDFAAAIESALNFSNDLGNGLASQIFTNLDNAGLLQGNSVDLEDLNAHNVTDHRASLTRADYPDSDAGKIDTDDISLDRALLNALIADGGSDGVLDVASLARSRNRVDAGTASAGYDALTADQQSTALAETGLLSLAMLGADANLPPASESPNYGSLIKLPADRVRTWLEQERLPFEKGWKKATRQYVLDDVLAVGDAVKAQM